LDERQTGTIIVEAAMRVHTALGAGLLESVYEACLAHELDKQGIEVKKQVVLPVRYDDLVLDNGFRLDLLVDNKVVVEIKAIDKLLPVHMAQLLSYLKLGKFKLGYLLNFNVVHMKDGIKRMVSGL
jgi:GxxExxY protein